MGISSELAVGPVTRNFMLQLNSITFLLFLEMLTGIKGLVGDPSFRGGGLHSTGHGGRLLVHADVERHPLGKPFCQMVNMITFLNCDWPESYGGNLELWSRDGSQCVRSISPVFNRTVIFESGTNTFHGHPQPLTCPRNRHRLSLAFYFYKIDRPFDVSYTSFQRKVTWIHDQEPQGPKSETEVESNTKPCDEASKAQC
jgi:Rps23 Pro-64 3,4-dihydroxylase Tpa1-like proline 4-hydroxylase